jgi:serralysin
LSAHDSLFGEAGNDRLYGGLGNDRLTGGAGQDVFVFDSALGRTNTLNKRLNLDTLTDFSVADDTIHLAKSVFKGITKRGVLKKAAFYAGSAAHDADDRIVYNKKTGALFYDPDGNGGHAATQIAKLAPRLKINERDFFLI